MWQRPGEDRLGSCEENGNTTHYYSMGGKYKVEGAKQTCDMMKGTWKDPS